VCDEGRTRNGLSVNGISFLLFNYFPGKLESTTKAAIKKTGTENGENIRYGTFQVTIGQFD
jgi:hypothetical protein